MVEKHIIDFSNLSEGEKMFIAKLKLALVKQSSVSEIQEIINNRNNVGRQGLLSSIEYDVKGFYELEQTEYKSIVLVEKFRNQTREEIFDLLLQRVNSVQLDGMSEFPERLYKHLEIRLKFEDRMIDVVLVQVRPWDYLLYKSPYYKDDCFVKFHYEWHSTGPEIIKLSIEDALKIEFSTANEIDDIINKYRVRS